MPSSGHVIHVVDLAYRQLLMLGKDVEMPWMTSEQLTKIGLGSIGNDCLVDSTTQIFGANQIFIGNRVRIDAFTILSSSEGRIDIEDNVHIASHCRIFGGGGVLLEFGSGLSSGSAIYSASDDFVGEYLSNPTFPKEYRLVKKASVILGELSVVGTNSVLLPGVSVGRAAAVGAGSVVTKSTPDLSISAGSPARVVGERRNDSIFQKAEDYKRALES